MSGPTMGDLVEPVVVFAGWPEPQPPGLALADVVVTQAGFRRPSVAIADLFDRYPGLSIVVVAAPPAGLTAALRDGTALTVRTAGSGPVEAVATALYHLWVSTVDTTSLRGRHLAGSGRRVDVGTW
jgi:hypothetical protein